MTIDLKQEHKINILFAVVSIIGAGATIWWINQQNKHSKLEAEVFKLDKEIKELQLKKLKNVNN
jgi:hypothetical protein